MKKIDKKYKNMMWIGVAAIIGIVFYFILNWIFTFIAIIGIVLMVSTAFYKHRKSIAKFLSRKK